MKSPTTRTEQMLATASKGVSSTFFSTEAWAGSSCAVVFVFVILGLVLGLVMICDTARSG
jgi:hypothetical protein